VTAAIGVLSALTWPVLPIACTVAYARLSRLAVPPRQPRSRLASVLAVATGGVALASLLVGLVGGSTLAGDLWAVTADRGTVVTGSGLEVDRCRVAGETSRFEIGEPVAVLGILARQLPPGETVVLTVFRDGLPIGWAGSEPFDEPIDCVGGRYEPADIVSFGGSGRYRLEYRLGDELLASGEFEVVAAGGSGAPPTAMAGEPSPPPVVASPATTPPETSAPTPGGPGTVRFGRAAGADACSVSMVPIVFGVGDRVHLAANLRRPVSAGEEVLIAVRFGGDEIAADTLVADETTACLDGYLPTSGLAAGRYTIQFRVAAELLAEGDLVLAP
jgi:hypothetical protein